MYFVHIDVIRVNNASVPTYEDKHFFEWCGSREGILYEKNENNVYICRAIQRITGYEKNWFYGNYAVPAVCGLR